MNGMGLHEVETEKDFSVFRLRHQGHLLRFEIFEKERLRDCVGEIKLCLGHLKIITGHPSGDAEQEVGFKIRLDIFPALFFTF